MDPPAPVSPPSRASLSLARRGPRLRHTGGRGVDPPAPVSPPSRASLSLPPTGVSPLAGVSRAPRRRKPERPGVHSSGIR